MKSLVLESTIAQMCNQLVAKATREIKKAILENKKMMAGDFWFKEEDIIGSILVDKRLNDVFEFERQTIEFGQPYPDSFFYIYYSKKFNFFFLPETLYDDYEIISNLKEEYVLETGRLTGEKTPEGYGVMTRVYTRDPVLATIHTFEKPTSYNVPSIKVEYGFYELLETVCGIETYEIKKTINECRTAIKGLSRSASYYAKTDVKFKVSLFNKVFSKTLDKFSEEEIKLVYSHLVYSPYSETIIRMLLTYNYTLDLYGKHPNDFIDLTFIMVSLYKVVEILLCSYINKRFGNIVIRDRRNKEIDLSRDDLTLGEMNQIFYCNNEEIKSFLYNKYPYSNKLKHLLSDWIKYSRNGFLHKDSLEESNELEQSALDSLDVLFYIPLTFSK